MAIRRLLVSTFVLPILLALCLGPLRCEAAVTLTTLHSFTGPEDGANPAGLVQGRDGHFYGTTSDSDIVTTNGPFGRVFRITPDGAFTNLYLFSGANDGRSPHAGLAQDADGNFYGTTWRGGANGWGTIFKITPAGDFTTVGSFDGFPGDADSLLVPTSDGNLYTMGNHGGTSFLGTVFRVAPDGTVTVMVSFDGVGGFTGWFSTPLLQGADGNFYGTTQFGGPTFMGKFALDAGSGTLFKMTPDGILTSLVQFNGTNGYVPTALVQGADGHLYGTTAQGGSSGYGTVFKATTNGVLSTLAVFNNTNGSSPLSLMQARDGNFYGATSRGGTNGGHGTIFMMSPDGALTSLWSFNRTNGASPRYAPLVQAADGSFYGTTYFGGETNRGTIFRFQITSDPVFKHISQTGGGLNFGWTALAGRSYQVQFKTDLTQTNWSNLGEQVTATNTTASVSDVIGLDQQRFYRVVLLP